MDISFIRLTSALLLREVRSRRAAVLSAILAACSCAAGFGHYREWPTILLGVLATATVLQTSAFIAADLQSEWMAPLLAFGYSGPAYAVAVITARAVQSGIAYVFCILPFLLITGFSQPRAAFTTFVVIPQIIGSIAALCAFAALIALAVRDGTWAVALSLALLVGPAIYVIAFTAMHNALPSPRVQTMVSLHVPPVALRPNLDIYWKLCLYIGTVAGIAAGIGRMRVSRYS
jgi:hypothetical protein